MFSFCVRGLFRDVVTDCYTSFGMIVKLYNVQVE